MYKTGRQFIGLWLLLCSAVIVGVGQKQPPAAPAPKGGIMKPKPAEPARREDREERMRPPSYPGETSEKSIAIDPNASIKMCVLDGRLKVNGWNRNEMRVFVRNGSRIGIRVLEKSAESGKPIWLLVINGGQSGAPGPECLSGDSIELDVPRDASLNLSGRVMQTSIDSVKKVYVKNVEGSISLRNVVGGITATALQGDILLENSSGPIAVETTRGNIVAMEIVPGNVGDLFRARTNGGAISLRQIEHRQVEANSITGSVYFDGKLMSGGLYTFKTSNGRIQMLLPSTLSCTVSASYGIGLFNSDFEIKEVFNKSNGNGPVRSLKGIIGKGEATLNLTTGMGSITLRRN